jgi:hypothetical protein
MVTKRYYKAKTVRVVVVAVVVVVVRGGRLW